MSEKSLAERIDAFELELAHVESLIDLLYITPTDHEYHSPTLEDLQTHRVKMRAAYNDIRDEWIAKAVS